MAGRGPDQYVRALFPGRRGDGAPHVRRPVPARARRPGDSGRPLRSAGIRGCDGADEGAGLFNAVQAGGHAPGPGTQSRTGAVRLLPSRRVRRVLATGLLRPGAPLRPARRYSFRIQRGLVRSVRGGDHELLHGNVEAQPYPPAAADGSVEPRGYTRRGKFVCGRCGFRTRFGVGRRRVQPGAGALVRPMVEGYFLGRGGRSPGAYIRDGRRRRPTQPGGPPEPWRRVAVRAGVAACPYQVHGVLFTRRRPQPG